MTNQVIAVPLDGSELSEAALPYGAAFAKTLGDKLLLVGVWEGLEEKELADLRQVAKDIQHAANLSFQEYLQQIAGKLTEQGVPANALMVSGKPADEVLRTVAERDVAMLITTTHGRSGLGRWLYGSVASRLLREVSIPTLVVGPRQLAREERKPVIKSILVPLDGSALSESALRPAIDLAERFDAEITLAEVVEPAAYMFAFSMPEAHFPADLDQELEDAALQYLERVRSGHSKRIVAAQVLRGRPAETLIEFIASQHFDLIVMASHSRPGIARAVLGSVADRLLQGEAPVLLVRPHAAPAQVQGPAERGRFCHSCGRSAPYFNVVAEDLCIRCGQHLHACGNCVYFDGIACLVGRPEAHETHPGLSCPYFQFRETARAPGQTPQRARTSVQGH